jgi:hypothetical protein
MQRQISWKLPSEFYFKNTYTIKNNECVKPCWGNTFIIVLADKEYEYHMNPFSDYIDCINCGNELTPLSKLIMGSPETIECDLCGQKYPGLAAKIRRAKNITTTAFVFLAIPVFWITFTRTGILTSLFAVFPLYIIYWFVLGFIIKRIARF